MPNVRRLAFLVLLAFALVGCPSPDHPTPVPAARPKVAAKPTSPYYTPPFHEPSEPTNLHEKPAGK